MTVKISAYMLTCNNERTVDAALASITFADEIVVVDSGSTDRTLDLASKYTDRIVRHAWPGFREQYQFAQDQCCHDWAFFLDADEEVSPRMAAAIGTTLAANASLPEAERVQGFLGFRRTFFVDRWIRHGGWVPDREIRLYDRRHGRWEGGLHAKVHVDGPVAALSDYIYHDTYADISDQMRTLNSYSTQGAADLVDEGRAATVGQMLLHPFGRFLKEYVLKAGFRDGIPGLIIAWNNMQYAFNKYAKAWELRRRSEVDIAACKRQKPDT